MRALVIILLLGTSHVFGQNFSHASWDWLLKKNVSSRGVVNYGGFLNDQTTLNSYLASLAKTAPSASWSKNEQLAYWVNAYNAYTVDLILKYRKQGLKSIKDIGGTIKISGINTAWDIKFAKIGNKLYSLNDIEHDIVRKKFKEPRIHFALVCAARSCPSLRNEAYQASRLSSQLDSQGTIFFNDKFKNQIEAGSADISMLFDWYGGDFTSSKPITDWINKYSKEKVQPGAKVSYLKYDWSLNGSF